MGLGSFEQIRMRFDYDLECNELPKEPLARNFTGTVLLEQVVLALVEYLESLFDRFELFTCDSRSLIVIDGLEATIERSTLVFAVNLLCSDCHCTGDVETHTLILLTGWGCR